MAEQQAPTILVVRHGETTYNKPPERFRSWLDIPLTEKGKAQAKSAAKHIARRYSVREILAGDLQRTRDTAQIISKEAPCGFETTKGLRDWDVGVFKGKEVKPNLAKVNVYVTDTPTRPIPGGEAFTTFKSRLLRTLEAAQIRAEQHPGKAVVLVTHNRDVRVLLATKFGQDHKHDQDILDQKDDPIPPGGILELTKRGETWVGKELEHNHQQTT